MDWDKPSILAVVIGAAALIAWYSFAPNFMGSSVSSSTPAPAAANVQKTPTPSAPASGTVPVQQPAVPAIPALKTQPAVSITGNGSTYTIQPLTGTVEKITVEKFQKNDRSGNLEIINQLPALAGAQKEYGALGIRGKVNILTVEKILQSQKISDSEYLLVRQLQDNLGNKFNVSSRFKVNGNYQLQVTFNIFNPSEKVLMVPELIVSGGDLQQWCKLSGDLRSNAQEIHTVEYCTISGKVKSEEAAADDDDWAELNGQSVRWAGVTNRFFAQLLRCSEPLKMQLERIADPAGSKEFAVNSNLALEAFTLNGRSSREFTFDYYMGPKQPDALRKFDPEASEVMHLGWFPIDFLAYIMLALLNWLYGFVGSFGWSIILLTLLIRTIFFPVTMKANASMREMQQLSPKLKEIREKYKDEPMVAQTKMSELYREHHVNPLGGCLPMLIQIPVFIALYYALGSAAELRQQSFWWIKDLAQPDTVAHIFGLAINPLIIVWTLLMVVQQKLTPTAMDPMQAKVMLAMPLVMLFILYSLPAALTLYWSVSQIFSIAQMLYQNKLKQREEAQRQSGSQTTEKPRTVRS